MKYKLKAETTRFIRMMVNNDDKQEELYVKIVKAENATFLVYSHKKLELSNKEVVYIKHIIADAIKHSHKISDRIVYKNMLEEITKQE